MTQALRIEGLEMARTHYAADMLLKGQHVDTGADEFKGCSVGCFLREVHPEMSLYELFRLEPKHKLVADRFGYTEWLAQLQDTIFEGLPNGESAKWHVQLFETMAQLPDDYDWQAALHRVHVALLRVSYKTAGSAQDAVQAVIDLHERAGRGEDVSDELWSTAEFAARSAARSTAESAARSIARSIAYQEMRDGVLAALLDFHSEVDDLPEDADVLR